MKRVHLIISGDVQGVGFRAWVLRWAKMKHVTGWVKNRADGSVELVAEALRSTLEELIRDCQHGPEVAWVEHVDVAWEEGTGEYVDFSVQM